MRSIVDPSKKKVEKNEGLVVPSTRTSARATEDATAVVAGKIVGSCGKGGLESSVLIFEPSEALFEDNVGPISRPDSSRQSSARELRYR